MSLDPPIRRIRADNPSLLTGSGTNSWIVGSTDLAVIDPGPDDSAHLAALLKAVGPGQRIGYIIVTHAHRDHSALAPKLSAATGAPVIAFGTATAGRTAVMEALAETLPASGEGLDIGFSPDQTFGDGDVLSGTDWAMSVLHTPGHLGGHVCLALGDLLFSGDHVMGWSTSLVAPPDGDMGAYLASLHRLSAGKWRQFLPGHGETVDQPSERIEELIAHRRAREAQILGALSDGPSRIPALTARIYQEVSPRLLPAAERNVFAHLIDLSGRRRVTASPALHPDAEYSLL